MSNRDHTDHNETRRRLAEITDAGLFEHLATAVLRQANPGLYGNLTHPGVNSAGKPVKSPVDGIAFVPGANPPHMVIAHHTAGVVAPLPKKWLHDPSEVKSRRGRKPTAPQGDILKTMDIVNKERLRTPALRVTLALTTTTEPLEELTRDVADAEQRYDITIDIWSVSRIAHYLDHEAEGQWLRKFYLNIVEQRLSISLLRELSRDSLESLPLMAAPDTLIERELEKAVGTQLPRPVGFLVGESGSGKTTACYRHLQTHVSGGGCGLILTHEILFKNRTLDQAIDAELRRIHPSLELSAGTTARALCTPSQPLLILVEDVSRSSQPALLLERLASWVPAQSRETENRSENWRLLCPIWPQKLATMAEEARKRIDSLCVMATRFTPAEGRAAVECRAMLAGQSLSFLQADQLAEALGYDPLLIGLCDLSAHPRPKQVISDFIASNLRRLADPLGNVFLSDYQSALRMISRAMLQGRCIDPSWETVRGWTENQPDQIAAIRQIVKDGKVLSLSERNGVGWLAFRHDRVRAWLLAEAALELMKSGLMKDDLLAEPFFAEVIGNALAESEVTAESVERVKMLNPLAIFHAFKALSELHAPGQATVLEAIKRWVVDETTHGRAQESLRLATLQVLAETDSPQVPDIVSQFREQWWPALKARFRNGDLRAGLTLCLRLEPSGSFPWRDQQIAHAKLRFGATLIQELSELLHHPDFEGALSGALRLAGHFGAPILADSIAAAWEKDAGKEERLADYLWAAAQCCGDDAGRLLGPVCDAWALLPDKSSIDGMHSPRDDLAADHISWAFNEALPLPALRYFIEQASRPELRWPITFMLRGVDQPDAQEFIARELASYSCKAEGTNRLSTFQDTVRSFWEWWQSENGRAMSDVSRQRLRELWDRPENDKHLRQQSFRLWAATSAPDDVNLLQSVKQSECLADDILRARLKKGDHSAIPFLLEKLPMDEYGGWWQLGRHLWSEELTAALGESFQRRVGMVERTWGAGIQSDWITAELTMRLPCQVAEELLERHWEHLRFSRDFIQAALYIATPRSAELAGDALSQCPEPGEMLKHVSMHFGIQHIRQLEALIPYLDLISDSDIYSFWECCNKHGWYSFRHTHLDHRLQGQSREHALLDEKDIFAEWDRRVDGGQFHWVDISVDRLLSSGEQWRQISSLLGAWLGQRQTISALQLATTAILHAGCRADLETLCIDDIEPIDEADAIIKDTSYTFRLRSFQ